MGLRPDGGWPRTFINVFLIAESMRILRASNRLFRAAQHIARYALRGEFANVQTIVEQQHKFKTELPDRHGVASRPCVSNGGDDAGRCGSFNSLSN
jgi:hypothetical protein